MQELPPRWRPTIDGDRTAVYEYDAGTLSIEINPRKSHGRPDEFRVELKRHSRLGTATTLIGRYDTMQAAKTEARDVIARFAARNSPAQRRFRAKDDELAASLSDSVSAIGAVADSVGYSPSLLREHLRSVVQDGLRAAFLVDGDTTETVFLRDDVEEEWGERALREAFESLSALQAWEASFSSIGDDAIRSTAVLLDSAQLYKIRGPGTVELVVSIDYEYHVEHPVWIEECRAILDAATHTTS